MRRAHITDEDLAEALRLQIQDDDPSTVGVAYMEMERSGDISMIPCMRGSSATPGPKSASTK